MEGKKDYQEKLFSNFQLNDRVPLKASLFFTQIKNQLILDYEEKQIYLAQIVSMLQQ